MTYRRHPTVVGKRTLLKFYDGDELPQWKLVCPFCGKIHTHGEAPGEPPVHRVAHCADGGSYFIIPAKEGEMPPHVCIKKHRTFNALARCIWDDQIRARNQRGRKFYGWVDGEGPFAVVSQCRGTTITLWLTESEAQEAKDCIDRTGCGGACSRDHKIEKLEK